MRFGIYTRPRCHRENLDDLDAAAGRVRLAPNRLFLLDDVVGAVAMAGVPPYSSEAAFDADTAAAPHASLETVQRARCSGSMSAPWSSRRSDTRPMGRMIYA